MLPVVIVVAVLVAVVVVLLVVVVSMSELAVFLLRVVAKIGEVLASPLLMVLATLVFRMVVNLVVVGLTGAEVPIAMKIDSVVVVLI